MRYACYLGDGVNKQMNGKVMNTPYRQTIMGGLTRNVYKKKFIENFKNTPLCGCHT